MPRKQRHTATRIWQRLVDELGADISASAVRVMVRELKAEIIEPPATAMVPQLHLPGKTAEVDFGDVWVILAGHRVKAKMFAMRLSASGKAFHEVYSGESQECFFDGHEKAFLAFGGIPGTIRYDNLTSAVTKVLIGRDRLENERFVAFRSHYGFAASYCTPGIDGAHEKGGIEGEVKRARRRYLVPIPKGSTLTEINDKIHERV
ncbi:IstA2, partial [mine drainage metagenome]